MTKLLKVKFEVCWLDELNEERGDSPFITEVDRYYTSEDIAEAFVFADTKKFDYSFHRQYYCISFYRKWVEVDKSEIPEQMINTSAFREICHSMEQMGHDALDEFYMHHDVLNTFYTRDYED